MTKMVPTFAQGAAGEPVAVIGSSGYVEIAVNKGNAAKSLATARGVEVTVEWADSCALRRLVSETLGLLLPVAMLSVRRGSSG